MEYETKGEFIQAIKDYAKIEQKIVNERENIAKLKYLRFEKVKSPLDYDVVGYGKNNEPIRQIKGRGSYNPGEITENQEKLDRQIEESWNRLNKLKKMIEKIDKELSKIAEPLKSLLILKYRNKMTLKDLVKKYPRIAQSESGMYKYIDRSLDEYYE